MPKAMEEALKRRAEAMARAHKLKKKKGQTTEEAKNAFVYGTMRHKIGWKPSSEM